MPGQRSVRIEFVNHASVILHFGEVHLISDPWLEGTAFNDSWKLLAETRFKYEDFRNITHIWFSHEHPDHFSPPNIQKISAEDRARITVLYRATADRKVVSFCRQLGFKHVIELRPRQWFELGTGLKCLCYPYHDDSALAVKAGRQVVLNINDCVVRDREAATSLKQLIGNLDVLLTQFSYASYAGETREERRRHAERKYREMPIQAEVFSPTYVIPFASYVWFCHEENYHMNDGVNRIDDVLPISWGRAAPNLSCFIPQRAGGSGRGTTQRARLPDT
jgi:hypothetical protein